MHTRPEDFAATYPYYMEPAVAAALRAHMREEIDARRKRREQAVAFDAALEQFKRIGFDDEAARELAGIQVGAAQ